MTTEYKSFKAREGEFGASSGFMAKIENGKVSEILVTSTGETNYVWDFYPDKKEFVGLSGKELSDKMDHYYDDFNDEYRHPWIYEENISKETYEAEKARQDFADEIEKRRHNVWARKEELYKKIGNRPDMLAEKEVVLRYSEPSRPVRKAYRADYPQKVAKARTAAAKRFMKRNRGM